MKTQKNRFDPDAIGQTPIEPSPYMNDPDALATADKISNCRATLSIWMYNEMSRRSFGQYADHWYFKFRPMASQFMWWHWKEEFEFDDKGNVKDIPSSGGGW